MVESVSQLGISTVDRVSTVGWCVVIPMSPFYTHTHTHEPWMSLVDMCVCVCVEFLLGEVAVVSCACSGIITSSQMFSSGHGGAVFAGLLMLIIGLMFGALAALDFFMLLRVSTHRNATVMPLKRLQPVCVHVMQCDLSCDYLFSFKQVLVVVAFFNNSVNMKFEDQSSVRFLHAFFKLS